MEVIGLSSWQPAKQPKNVEEIILAENRRIIESNGGPKPKGTVSGWRW